MVGANHPAPGVVVPRRRFDLGVEQRTVAEAVLLDDGLEMYTDLFARCVARRRDGAHLLEHRHVDVGLDVAHQAGVTVPVPRAAEAAGLVDEPESLDPRLAQLGAHDHAGEPCADDYHVDLVNDGVPRRVLRERVGEVVGESLVVGEVDREASGASNASGALGLVLRVHRVGVERRDLVARRFHQQLYTRSAFVAKSLSRSAGSRPAVSASKVEYRSSNVPCVESTGKLLAKKQRSIPKTSTA